jgi:hypothetical protein
MEKAVMHNFCRPDLTTLERELAAAGEFFAEACAPGLWVPDRQTDRQLST